MPRGRPPKRPVAQSPDDLPVGIPDTDIDGADPDPQLEDERADGGDTRSSGGPSLDAGNPFGDPFERLRQQMGMDQQEQPTIEIPQPGSTQAVTEEALARRGTTEYPDDMLVTVRLWEVNEAGVAGDPLIAAHNVLYSTAKEPLTWIEYGGKWYMELIQPETKKKLVRKTFTTRGDPAPKNWRPRIGGEEMTFEQFMKMFSQANATPQGTIGVPTGVHANVEAGLRTDLGEVKGELRELRSKLETASSDLAETRRQRDMAASKYDALKERFDDLKGELSSVRSELTTLRNNPPKGDGKPDWAYAAEVFGKRDDGNGVKMADIMRLQEKFTETLMNMKSGGSADQFQTLNAALDMVEKTRKAAGVQSVGGAKDEDTLNKLLGLAGKAADLVKGRQRLVEIERGGSPPAQLPPASQPNGERSEQDMDREALERTLHRLEVAFHDHVNPERVGQMLASAITWAAAMDFASLDADVKVFMAKIVEDPDKWIVWYAENLDPKIEDATVYGKAVAESFKVAMNRSQPVAQPKSDGGNGKPKPEASVSQPVSPPPAAQPGSVGGDGGVLPSPPAPDEPQVPADAVVQPEAEVVAEAPKVN